MNKAIVYNCSYNGLSIIQELGAKGISCIAMDCIPAVGVFSKYARFKKCPSPLKDEVGFIKYLIELCSKQEKKPVLFPTNDEWARVTAKYKKELQKVAYTCVGNYDVVDLLLDKSRFYDLGKKRNYMTPVTWSYEEVISISDSQFPIVAKAKYKTLPQEKYNLLTEKKLRSNRLSLINNLQELKSFRKDNAVIAEHLIFQEYVSGKSDSMYTVGIYADKNYNIKARFTGRKVRGYPADIGDNIVGQSERLPDSLIKNAERMVKELNYSGIAEFEYKKDSASGEYHLIEVNPRSWSWIGITPACGVNIPYIAYRDLIGEEVSTVHSTAETGEVKYIKVYQDFINCLFRYRKNHKPWAKSYAEWRNDIQSQKMVIAEYNRGDWPILLSSIPYVIAKLIKG